ncbi:hypothetical protein GCM10018781_18130 [Kitasatospora indigofera]|uniref:Uncharacterized protein n=1 Tax=Kitasatospora indigofera TaxID=67307 RepID=A0A919KNI9_9ACTN|nr:hypothetical protein [Kitasatospora indigofera]GHH65507.1 hypothetical protein GCM10018781_18130 [Kitasatospora indigofera]
MKDQQLLPVPAPRAGGRASPPARPHCRRGGPARGRPHRYGHRDGLGHARSGAGSGTYGGPGGGTWYHQLVRNGIWTCPYSPIPAGYRSTGYDARGCSGLGAWLTVRA